MTFGMSHKELPDDCDNRGVKWRRGGNKSDLIAEIEKRCGDVADVDDWRTKRDLVRDFLQQTVRRRRNGEARSRRVEKGKIGSRGRDESLDRDERGLVGKGRVGENDDGGRKNGRTRSRDAVEVKVGVVDNDANRNNSRLSTSGCCKKRTGQ